MSRMSLFDLYEIRLFLGGLASYSPASSMEPEAMTNSSDLTHNPFGSVSKERSEAKDQANDDKSSRVYVR